MLKESRHKERRHKGVMRVRRLTARILAASLALITTVSLALLLAAAPVRPAQAAVLKDIGGHWARAQIEAGVRAGYVSGFPDGTFRPEQAVTRAEFFKLLAGALRLEPQPSMAAPFAETEHWSMREGRIQAAVSGGLLNPADYLGVRFGPDVRITRQEIVLAAVRAAGLEPRVGDWELTTPDVSTYPDWLRAWAAAAVENGLLSGYPDGRLHLDRTATRAEAVVLVQRILERVTMRLSPAETEPSPAVIRYPAAGEPVWRVEEEAQGRPRFTDGTYRYELPEAVQGHSLMPAPGGAAWLLAAVPSGGGEAHLYRLAGGRSVLVQRWPGAVTPLAVDAEGRLWLSRGGEALAAAPDGSVRTIAVGEELRLGESDGRGNLWAVGEGALYRIASSGQWIRLPTGLGLEAEVRHLAVAGDGTVWLLLPGKTSRLEGVQLRLRPGPSPALEVVWRGTLLPAYFGGNGRPVQAAALGGTGPVRWVLVVADGGGASERQASLFRLDLETGAFTRMVPPSAVSRPHILPAPDGGAILRDGAGAFWRVEP